MTSNGNVNHSTNGHGVLLKPLSSPKESVQGKVEKQTRQAHIRNLSRLATLSTQVISENESPTSQTEINSTVVEDILAHGATTTLFGEIFSELIQKDRGLSREELNQKLINWILKVPSLKAKLDDLPEDVQGYVEEFGRCDLNDKEAVPKIHGFKRPTSPISARNCEALKSAWEKQYEVDGGMGHPSVVEGDGDAVKYVDKIVFKNWGDTVESTPAV